MRVVIESGAFYTISVVILVVVYMLSSNAELPVSDAVSHFHLCSRLQAITLLYRLSKLSYVLFFPLFPFPFTRSQGITFNIIITRVDRGDVTQPTSAKSSDATLRSHVIPLHMISIQTSVTRHQESDEISDFTLGRDGTKRLVSYS